MNRLLILLFTFFIANTALADYQITSDSKVFTASTEDAACQQYYNYLKSAGVSLVSYSVSGGMCRPKNSSGGGGYDVVIKQVNVQSQCADAPGVQKQYGSGSSFINLSWPQGSPIPTKTCISFSGGFCPFVISGTDSQYINIGSSTTAIAYSASATPVSQCSNQTDNACDPKDPYGKCYTPPNDGCTRQSNGSIVCPPDTTPPSPEPTCKYSTSGAYCTPQNGQCPSGYINGTYNGQNICVKDSKNPPPTDPNNQQGDGACNGTGNCSPNSNNTTTNNHTTNNTTNNSTTNTTNTTTNNNTTEVTQELDDSGIIAAINSTSATIVQTITSKSDAIKTAVDAVKNTADSILDKLGIVDKSIKDAAQQAKTDAKSQLDETKKQIEQDKEFQDWAKQNQKCTLSSNGTYKTGGETTANSKMCDLSDSFEDYKKWVQGKRDGDGIPKDPPNGKIEVEQTGLSESINTNKFEANYVQFSASCPSDLTIAINVIKSGNITLSYQPFCQLASMLRPFIIAISYLSAAFIILGIGKGD